MNKRSFDFGLGVKGQSKPVIAGSCRSGPQPNLRGDSLKCKATDLKFRGRNPSVFCPTQKF